MQPYLRFPLPGVRALRGRRGTVAVIATLVVAALLAALATPAGADHGKLHYQKGRVKHIADGDTYDVDFYRDGTSALRRIRMTGIQTMEAGECHSKRAEASLRRMIMRRTVRMSAIDLGATAKDPNRAYSRNRALRYTDRKRDGRWKVDVGLKQIQRGNALWLPHGTEDVRHRKYHRAMMVAARKGKGLFNTTFCGQGRYPAKLPVKMWVQSDAPENDKNNLNGEYVEIYNNSNPPITMNLSGWRLRGASQIGYRIPKGTKVRPGASLRVHTGKGTNRTQRDGDVHLYMGHTFPHWQNIFEYTKGYIGDGAYLFDKQGDLRKWFTYPCLPKVQNCDPNGYRGTIKITRIGWKGLDEDEEYVVIRNLADSGKTVDLYGYTLDSQPFLFDFPRGTILRPGETLKVIVGDRGNAGPDTTRTMHWRVNRPIFQSWGESVTLRSFDYVTLHCAQYGDPDRPCLSTYGANWNR